MPKIRNYITQDDGTTTVVIENVEIDNKTSLLLDNDLEVECEVKLVDPFLITDKQRRKVFALCNDIESYTGQPREYMREMFQDYVTFLYGYDKHISLSNCSREQARQVIEVILDWVFHNNIPLNYKTSDLLKNDKSFLYWATVNRNCVLCGKNGADIAHHYAIGRGANRKRCSITIMKYWLYVEHHSEQHNIGVKSFDEKYILQNSWIKVDKRLNRMLKGVSDD